MSFSRDQIPAYHATAGRAWSSLSASERNGTTLDAWKRDLLEAATGNRSCKDCDSRRDFEFVMARLEIAGCLGIHWQLRLEQAVVERVLHVVRTQHADAKIRPEYMLATVRRWSPGVESLGQITTEDEDGLIRALLQHLRRDN